MRLTLAKRAQDWRWGSAFVRLDRSHDLRPILSEWPVPRPHNWLEMLNTSPSDAEQAQVQEHIHRSSPMGLEEWVKTTASALGLRHTLRPRGRPTGWRKSKHGEK